MKAYTINPQKQELQEIELEMQANTVYTFFSSILIDEVSSLQQHTIYTNAEAISKAKEPFFLGEQLIIGDALIFGKKGLEDVDVIISQEELASLINYNVPDFYKKVLSLLQNTTLNIYTMFNALKDDEKIELNSEWVLYIFNIADDRTKEYFLNELQKAIEEEKDILDFMHKMATLALNATK